MTIVINFFAGPGAGKSTMMAGLFYKLKQANVIAEMAPEFAKELVWGKLINLLKNQLYVAAEQYKRVYILKEAGVEVVVTDSPALLGLVYDPDQCEILTQLLLKKHNEFNNVNYFINRKKPFVQEGRVHTEKQSLEKDRLVRDLLSKNKIQFTTVESSDESLENIKNHVLKLLGK